MNSITSIGMILLGVVMCLFSLHILFHNVTGGTLMMLAGLMLIGIGVVDSYD